MKKAIITGLTGQDGSYLAELLLSKGYEVHGLKRRVSSLNTTRVDHIYQDSHEYGARFLIHYADLADGPSITRLISEIAPDEVYNLAAMSHVRVSFEVPESTADITAVGALRMLDATRRAVPHCRFYQASSSEMFGSTPAPQNEDTRFHPRSPYACAKLFAHAVTVNYREAYGMHASSGILFNHESPRRGETFVTRKVTQAVARIKLGLQDRLYLGNLSARRDWGYAPDYVQAMWLMLQQEEADDYVIGTGESHTVREFVEKAFARVNLDWQDYVSIDPRYNRPSEVDFLLADPTKARRRLGWEPTVTFDALIRIMVDADFEEMQRQVGYGAISPQTVQALGMAGG